MLLSTRLFFVSLRRILWELTKSGRVVKVSMMMAEKIFSKEDFFMFAQLTPHCFLTGQARRKGWITKASIFLFTLSPLPPSQPTHTHTRTHTLARSLTHPAKETNTISKVNNFGIVKKITYTLKGIFCII